MRRQDEERGLFILPGGQPDPARVADPCFFELLCHSFSGNGNGVGNEKKSVEFLK
jgi:hypothetical protein